MKDKLEQYIEQHRQAFDSASPRPALWEQIDEQVNGPHKVRRLSWRHIARIAAAVLLVLVVGAVIGNEWQKRQQGDTLSKELTEIEAAYQNRIKVQMTRLSDSGYHEAVYADLKELETFVAELKTELHNTPESGREAVLTAIINNYRARLEILQMVLQKLESSQNQQSKNSKNDENIKL